MPSGPLESRPSAEPPREISDGIAVESRWSGRDKPCETATGSRFRGQVVSLPDQWRWRAFTTLPPRAALHREQSHGEEGRTGTRLQRQEETIRGLPKGFKYPLFSGWQAIQSQRKSGYKTTARAAREIVDNSIEAGTDNVYVVFDVLPDKDPYRR